MGTLAKAYKAALIEDLRAILLAPLLAAIGGTLFWSLSVGLMSITEMAPWGGFRAGFLATFLAGMLVSLPVCYAVAPIAWVTMSWIKVAFGPLNLGTCVFLGAVVPSILVAALAFVLTGKVGVLENILFLAVYGALGGYFYFKLTGKSKDQNERPV